MPRSDKTRQRLRQAGCGGCIAGVFGAFLSWAVLMLAGVSQFLLAASAAIGLGIGATFAAWLHSKRLDGAPGDSGARGAKEDEHS